MIKNTDEKISFDGSAIIFITDGNHISFFGSILIDGLCVDFSNWLDNLDFSANCR